MISRTEFVRRLSAAVRAYDGKTGSVVRTATTERELNTIANSSAVKYELFTEASGDSNPITAAIRAYSLLSGRQSFLTQLEFYEAAWEYYDSRKEAEDLRKRSPFVRQG